MSILQSELVPIYNPLKRSYESNHIIKKYKITQIPFSYSDKKEIRTFVESNKLNSDEKQLTRPREILNKPNEIFNKPIQIFDKPIKDLNNYVIEANLTPEEIKKIKDARRRHKNCIYSRKARLKRKNQKEIIENVEHIIIETPEPLIEKYAHLITETPEPLIEKYESLIIENTKSLINENIVPSLVHYKKLQEYSQDARFWLLNFYTK
jgi:hypothetical protein